MRKFIRANLVSGLLLAVTVVCGCAGNSSLGCGGSVVSTVAPTSATVNHSAAPPANQVQFVGYSAPSAPPGCPIPAFVAITYGTWSNPDSADIQISSANDSTNGTALCKAPTDGAVTLTGAFPLGSPSPITKSVQLTCE